MTGFWKQARGDHIMVAAFTSSIFISLFFSMEWFGGNSPFSVVFFFFSMIAGFIIPMYFIPVAWVNNELPKYHFWRDLLS